jgi:hypothetical protein
MLTGHIPVLRHNFLGRYNAAFDCFPRAWPCALCCAPSGWLSINNLADAVSRAITAHTGEISHHKAMAMEQEIPGDDLISAFSILRPKSTHS